MPTGAFNICCPRDCVSRTANVERTGRHKWVNMPEKLFCLYKGLLEVLINCVAINVFHLFNVSKCTHRQLYFRAQKFEELVFFFIGIN